MLKRLFFFVCVITLNSYTFAYEENAEKTYKAADSLKHISYTLADSLIRVSIETAENESSGTIDPKFYYLAAKIQSGEGFHHEAEVYFKKAIDVANAQNKTKLALEYQIRLADNFLDKGNFSNAVELNLSVINKALELDDSSLVLKSYGSLAEIYRVYDQYELAIKYNKLAIQYAIALDNNNSIGRSYSNLSSVLGEIGRNEEAIDSLKKGLSLIAESNLFGRAKMTSNIGFCYRNLGKYEEALKYHRNALALKQKANMQSSFGYSLGAIGRAHMGLNNLDSAIFYTQKELEYANRFKNPHQIRDAVSHLADAYAANGNFKPAYELGLKKKEIEDSLYEAEIEQKVLLYQRKFDIALKEKEIEQLKSEQLLKEAAQENKVLLLSGLFVLACLIAILFRNRAVKKQREKELVEVRLKNTQQEIEEDKRALSDFTNDLMSKNKSIKQLSEQLLRKENELLALRSSKSEELEKLSQLKILTEEDWRKFRLLFEKVYPNFFSKLNTSFIKFTKGEKRLMALLKLDMENNEIADTLGISSESVSKSRFRLKKKLEEHSESSIEDFVFRS